MLGCRPGLLQGPVLVLRCCSAKVPERERRSLLEARRTQSAPPGRPPAGQEERSQELEGAQVSAAKEAAVRNAAGPQRCRLLSSQRYIMSKE